MSFRQRLRRSGREVTRTWRKDRGPTGFVGSLLYRDHTAGAAGLQKTRETTLVTIHVKSEKIETRARKTMSKFQNWGRINLRSLDLQEANGAGCLSAPVEAQYVERHGIELAISLQL